MNCSGWLYLLTHCLLHQSYRSAQEKINIKFSKTTILNRIPHPDAAAVYFEKEEEIDHFKTECRL
jgi:hypothetical protein